MIKYITIIFFLSSIAIQAQTKKEIKNALKTINSKENAQKCKLKNPKWQIELAQFSNLDNVSSTERKLKNLKVGKSKTVKISNIKYHYKLLSKTPEDKLRVSYIYLNGKEISKKQIDSIRPLIIEKFKSGVPFEKLVKEFNMDGNSKKGDLGWFKKGVMVPEFENAVSAHKKNDIFFVDVHSNQWYYVVLKTHNDTTDFKFTFIRIKER